MSVFLVVVKHFVIIKPLVYVCLSIINMVNLPPLRSLIICCLVAFGGSFQVGVLFAMLNPIYTSIYIFIMSTCQTIFGRGLYAGEFRLIWSALQNCVLFGSMISGLVIGPILARFGIRKSFMVCILCFIACCLVSGHNKHKGQKNRRIHLKRLPNQPGEFDFQHVGSTFHP